MNLRSTTLALALVGGLASVVRAQNGTSLTATITIQPSISVSTVRNMDFGIMSQGITDLSISDPANDPRSAQVHVSARALNLVTVGFVLPADLSDGAGHTIPITEWFGTFIAIGPGNTAFTPSMAGRTTTQIGNDGNLELFLGSHLGIDSNQFPATYTGVILVDVFYF